MAATHAQLDELFAPPRLHSRAEIVGKQVPVPRSAGAYAWYIDEPPTSIPLGSLYHWQDHWLMYVGIAPRRPSVGKPLSTRTLAHRIREHYALNAYGSTLRLTLGCLLGLELRRIESKNHPGRAKRMTFGPDGEAQLSTWMEAHARVVWLTSQEPWLIEMEALRTFDLPLNLHGNRHSGFHAELTRLRAAAKAHARQAPPLRL